MQQPIYESLSLSADEMALAFSLINQSELGKGVLTATYGSIPASKSEVILTTASHSLIAHGFASLTSKQSVALDTNLEQMLFRLVKYGDILQVTINDGVETGPQIINIHLSSKGQFTAHFIELGVVHRLHGGLFSALPELISHWVKLPTSIAANLETDLAEKSYVVRMQAFAELMDPERKDGAQALQALGVKTTIANALAKDSQAPIRRGSIVLANTSSESKEADFNQAGAGLLFLVGPNASWLFSFDKATDNTSGRLLPGTTATLFKEVKRLIP